MGTNLKTVIKSTIKKVAIFSVTILLGAIIEFLRKFDLFYFRGGASDTVCAILYLSGVVACSRNWK